MLSDAYIAVLGSFYPFFIYLKVYIRHILRLMTIFTGSHGSIYFYYKGLLIRSFPLTKKNNGMSPFVHGAIESIGDMPFSSKKIKTA